MVAFIGIQHPRPVEYITVRPGDRPPAALGISARTIQGSMWGQSPFPCPLHITFVKETRRDGSSLKACFVFQAMQKVSGRNCLHYTVGLSLNQIGCFSSLFSHFLAYEHSREKKKSSAWYDERSNEIKTFYLAKHFQQPNTNTRQSWMA